MRRHKTNFGIPVLVQKVCPVCGLPFETRSRKAKTCSHNCSMKQAQARYRDRVRKSKV